MDCPVKITLKWGTTLVPSFISRKIIFDLEIDLWPWIYKNAQTFQAGTHRIWKQHKKYIRNIKKTLYMSQNKVRSSLARTITLHSRLRIQWSDKANNVVVCFNYKMTHLDNSVCTSIYVEMYTYKIKHLEHSVGTSIYVEMYTYKIKHLEHSVGTSIYVEMYTYKIKHLEHSVGTSIYVEMYTYKIKHLEHSVGCLWTRDVARTANLTPNPYSAGIDFSRQNLTSVDVRFSILKSIPAL